MPKKPSKTTLKNKLDKVFSKIVRNIGHCERCGATQNLDCAHIYSRRFINTRWDLNNAVALCKKCHMWGHHRPVDFAKWIEEYIGGDIISELKKKADELTYGKFDYEDKLKELKEIEKTM